MIPFDFNCPTRIIYGPGKLAELGSLASGLGSKRALVVSDRGIRWGLLYEILEARPG